MVEARNLRGTGAEQRRALRLDLPDDSVALPRVWVVSRTSRGRVIPEYVVTWLSGVAFECVREDMAGRARGLGIEWSRYARC